MTRLEVVVPERFAEAAAERIATSLQAALERRPGRVSLALSGGETPAPVYRTLSSRPLAWERVDVFLVDERAVPRDHPDSNGRLVAEALVEPSGMAHEQLRWMDADGGDAERAAAAYGALLPERLDVIVLGIGADGHTASLFPDGTDWTAGEGRVLITRSPSHPHRRMTLAPAALDGAAVFMLVAGRGKRAAVSRALEDGPVREVPARLARDARWIVDQDADPGS